MAWSAENATRAFLRTVKMVSMNKTINKLTYMILPCNLFRISECGVVFDFGVGKEG